MTKASILALFVAFALIISCSKSSDTAVTPDTTSTTVTTGTYNDLWIPPTLTGTTFNLTLAKTTKQMRTGAVTNTYSYNNTGFWGPTLIMNKGDLVKMNVTNNLPEATTTHWHGFHIPAIMDGGPHQIIDAGTTWTPSFEIKNNAGTYWYHPHLHEKTKAHLTYGAGGLIIIKDPAESALALPRTYGEDDIPLILTSRSYNASNAFDLSARAYGDYQLTNGTSNAQVSLPKQFVRLRILNAEIERGYNLGFSDNRTFYVITNDGGLLDAPVPVTRVKMMVGERVEILVNLGADAVGSSLDLKAYNSGQAFGFPGGEPNTTGDFGSLLNNKDFTVLHINVKAATASGITALPAKLTTNTYWTNADVTNSRTITITGGQGATAFSFDNNVYGDTRINQTLKLNAVEKWTITNNNIFGHSFHIHDIQFKIISRSSGTVAAYESGWKDTVYVPVGESVSVIAKFDDFASTTNAYMYHCHFSNHEDGGMMGQFLVTQ
ncbi:multicopper oxidase family protein [uncultured Fibrella sp.]|uniref:multicopper oxidase family protein n=1 Tax=uncultured Fibrella sp. TaxID=1284596 RepID=UPI0035CC51B9